MKLYNEPIDVELDAENRLATIFWRRRTLAVKTIQEEWTYDGKWWTTPDLQGVHRDYYRISCAELKRGAAGRMAVGRTVVNLEIYHQKQIPSRSMAPQKNDCHFERNAARNERSAVEKSDHSCMGSQVERHSSRPPAESEFTLNGPPIREAWMLSRVLD